MPGGSEREIIAVWDGEIERRGPFPPPWQTGKEFLKGF